MILPEIEIALVGRGWAMQWKTPDGVQHRQLFGNRKVLCDLMPSLLASVRGDPPDLMSIEEITITVPRRRLDDPD